MMFVLHAALFLGPSSFERQTNASCALQDVREGEETARRTFFSREQLDDSCAHNSVQGRGGDAKDAASGLRFTPDYVGDARV